MSLIRSLITDQHRPILGQPPANRFATGTGLDEPAKKRLIEEGTAILGRYAAIGEAKTPAYVAIQEIPEINWGMYGKQVDLSAMRAPADA